MTKNLLITAPHISYHLLHAFLALKHRQLNGKSYRSITRPLLFMVGQLIVVLWCHENTYCDVILTDCPQNVSKWVMCVFPPLSSLLSLMSYQVRFTAFSLAVIWEMKNIPHGLWFHAPCLLALCSDKTYFVRGVFHQGAPAVKTNISLSSSSTRDAI